jgi:hypothetical protein
VHIKQYTFHIDVRGTYRECISSSIHFILMSEGLRECISSSIHFILMSEGLVESAYQAVYISY